MDDLNLKEIESYILREYAHRNGNAIYDFMKKYNIGESEYGQLMDAAAKGKDVMAHRLYGHNFFYDFPYKDLEKAPEFLEHLLSDAFTKQGLPIIPGEILEDTRLLDYCKHINNPNWNFVNGFDVLLGTVSIYKGYNKFKKMYNQIESVDDFKDLADTFGIGTIELIIAISSANPLLLIGAVLHLTSGVRGFLNDGTMIYFNKMHNSLTVEFSLDALNVEKYLSKISIDKQIEDFTLDSEIESMSVDNN